MHTDTSLGVVGRSDKALDTQTRFAEVEQQSHGHVRCRYIVQAAGVKNVMMVACRFDLQDDNLINEEIRLIVADNNAIVDDIERLLLFHRVTVFAQLMRQSVLIDFFEKSGAEGIQDRESVGNDLLGERIEVGVRHSIFVSVCICVHLWLNFFVWF